MASSALHAVGMSTALRGTAVRQAIRATAGTITSSAQAMNTLAQLPAGRRAMGLAFLVGAGFYVAMIVFLLLFLFVCMKAVAAYFTAMESNAVMKADFEEERLRRAKDGDDDPKTWFDAQDQFEGASSDYATNSAIEQSNDSLVVTLVMGAAASTLTSVGGGIASIIGFSVDGISTVLNYYLWAAIPGLILGILFAGTGVIQAQSASILGAVAPFILNLTSFTNFILYGLLGLALLIWQAFYGVIVSGDRSAVYYALLPLRVFFECSVDLIGTITADLGNVLVNFLLCIAYWLQNPLYMEIPLLNTMLAIGQFLENLLGSPVLCICFALWYIVGGIFKTINSYSLAVAITSFVNFYYVSLMTLVVRPVISLLNCIEGEIENGTCPNFTRPSVYRIWQLQVAAADNLGLFIQNATVQQFDIWVYNGSGLLPCQVNGTCSMPTDGKQWLVRFLQTNFGLALGNAADLFFALFFDAGNIIFNADQILTPEGANVFSLNYTYYQAFQLTTNLFSVLNTLPTCSNELVSYPGIPFSNLGYLIAAAINVIYIVKTCVIGEIYTLLTPPSQVPGYFSAQFLLSNNPLMTNYAAYFGLFANSFACVVAFADPYIGQSIGALLQAVIVYAPQVPIRLLLYIRYVLQYPSQAQILNNIDINQLEGLLINSTVIADIFYQIQPGANSQTCPNEVNFGCGLGLGLQSVLEFVVYLSIAVLKSVIQVLVTIILAFVPGNTTQTDIATANGLISTGDFDNANISAYTAGCKLGVAIGSLLPLDIPCLTSLNTSSPGICAVVEYPGQQYASISVCMGTTFCKIGDLVGVPVDIATLFLSQIFGDFGGFNTDTNQTFIYVVNQVFTIVFNRALAWVCPTAHLIDCVISAITGIQDTTITSIVCLIMNMFVFVLAALQDFIVALIQIVVNIIIFIFGGFANNAASQLFTIIMELFNLLTVDLVNFITSLLNLAISFVFVIVQGFCYAAYYLTAASAFPYSDCENLVQTLEQLVNPSGAPSFGLNPAMLWKKRSVEEDPTDAPIDPSSETTTTTHTQPPFPGSQPMSKAKRVLTREEAEIFRKRMRESCLNARSDEESDAAAPRVYVAKLLKFTTNALNELYRRNPSLARWPIEYGRKMRKAIEESQIARTEEAARSISQMRNLKRDIEAKAQAILDASDDHPALKGDGSTKERKAAVTVYSLAEEGVHVTLLPESNSTDEGPHHLHEDVINDVFVQDALTQEFGRAEVDPQYISSYMHANVTWASGSDCADLMRLLRHQAVDNMSASDFLALRNCVRMKSIAVVMQAAFPFLYIPEDAFYNTIMRVSVFSINIIRVLTCVTQWGSDRSVPVPRLFDQDYQRFWDSAGMDITVYQELYGRLWHGNDTTAEDEARIDRMRQDTTLTTYLRRNFRNLYALVNGSADGNWTAEADSIEADPILGPISRLYTTTSGMIYDVGAAQMAQNEAFINASEARRARAGSASDPYNYTHGLNDYGPAAINAHKFRMEMVDSQVKFFRWLQKIVNYFIGFYRAAFVDADPHSKRGETPWEIATKRALPTLATAALAIPSAIPRLAEQAGESWARRMERVVYYTPAFQDGSILLDYNPHLGGGIISSERNRSSGSNNNGSTNGVLYGPRHISRLNVGIGSFMEFTVEQLRLKSTMVMPWCMEIVANMTGRTYGEVYAEVAHTEDVKLAERMRQMCSDQSWKARMKAVGIDPEGEFGTDPLGYVGSIFRADGDGSRRARDLIWAIFSGIGSFLTDTFFLAIGEPIDTELDAVGNMMLRHAGMKNRRMPPPSWVPYAAEGKLDKMPEQLKRDLEGAPDASTAWNVASFAARKLGVHSLQNKLDECDREYQRTGRKDPSCRLENLRRHLRDTPLDLVARDGIPWQVMDQDLSEMAKDDKESVVREYFLGTPDPQTSAGRWRNGITASLREMSLQTRDRELLGEILHPQSAESPISHWARKLMTDMETAGENGILFRPASRLYKTLLAPPSRWNASGTPGIDRYREDVQRASTINEYRVATRKLTDDAPQVRVYRKMYVARTPGGDLVQILPHKLREPPTGWMQAMLALAEMRSGAADGPTVAFSSESTPVMPKDPAVLLSLILEGAQTRTSNASRATYAHVASEAHGRSIRLISAVDYETRARLGAKTPTMMQRASVSDATLQKLLRQSSGGGSSSNDGAGAGSDPILGPRLVASKARRAGAEDVVRLMGAGHAARYGAQQLEYAAKKMEIYVLENVAADASSGTGGTPGGVLAEIGTLFNKTCYTGIELLCYECLIIDNVIGLIVGHSYWTFNYYQEYFPIVVNDVASFFAYSLVNASTFPARSGTGGLNSPWIPAINQTLGSMFQLMPTEIEYGISFIRWIENVIGAQAFPWVHNGPLYQTILNYTNNLSYDIQNNKPYAIVAIYSALSFIEFDLGWEVCELIDTLMASGESNFGNIGAWAYEHLVRCTYTTELDCTMQQYSFMAGMIVVASYMLGILILEFLITLPLGSSGVVLPPTAIFMAIFFFPIHALITYNWSIGCLIFPMCYLTDAFELVIYSIFPKCPWWIGGWVLNDEYSPLNCQNMSINWTYVNCPNAGFMTVFDATRYADLALGWNITTYLESTFVATIYTLFWGRLESPVDFAATPWNVSQALYRTNAWCALATVVPGGFGAALLTLIAGGPFLFIVSAVPSVITTVLGMLSDLFFLIVLCIRSMQDAGNRITTAMRNIRYHKRRAQKAILNRRMLPVEQPSSLPATGMTVIGVE